MSDYALQPEALAALLAERGYKGPVTEQISFGYACGALRVTLDNDSESTGPRAHVSGFLGGLERVGVTTHRYLAGDDAPRRATAAGSGKEMSRSAITRGLADSARLLLGFEMRRRASRVIGLVDLLYERQATFQELGRRFQRKGSWWVIESNGPFWYEAGVHRRTLAFVKLARKMELRAYRTADLVVAVSEPLKEIIARESGRSEDDIFVLPNGTDCSRFEPTRATPKRMSAGPVIGFAGYMTEWAGLDDLVRAVAVLRRNGREVEAVLVGDGPCRDELETLARAEGVESAVHFLGHVPWDQMPHFLAGFDIAFSGQREMSIGAMYHSPQKLYEYQAMGLPIVASDYRDARGLVTETGAGWLFTPGDIDDLVWAIGEALSADDREMRGKVARANVVRSHSWDVRIADLLVELDRRGMLVPRRAPLEQER